MLSKFLDPKNDVAFRKILGTEKNRDILIHFLNDMLTFRERAPITKMTSLLEKIKNPLHILLSPSMVKGRLRRAT